MLKKLLVIGCLVASSNVLADCAATARIDTGALRRGNDKHIDYFKIAINNTTNSAHVYEICWQGHAQYVDHSQHFSAQACENVSIPAHQGVQKDYNIEVHTNFGQTYPVYDAVHLDAIISVRGECNADGNQHKVVPLQ